MAEVHDLKIKPLLKHGMSLMFIGINPSLNPKKGFENHFFGGKANLFWKLISSSGVLPYNQYTALDDQWLHKYYGLGFVNLVSRPTKRQSDIHSNEYDTGLSILRSQIALFKPTALCFVSTTIYSIFSGNYYREKMWGPQDNYIYTDGTDSHGSIVFVLPSTSNLGTKYSHQEKEKSFKALKQFLDDNNIIISIT